MAKAEGEVQPLRYVFSFRWNLFCSRLSSPVALKTLTWKVICEVICSSGQVQFAEIKMENGRSKGCGTVRFDCPESADNACRIMNGTKINGREVDVRIDRNA